MSRRRRRRGTKSTRRKYERICAETSIVVWHGIGEGGGEQRSKGPSNKMFETQYGARSAGSEIIITLGDKSVMTLGSRILIWEPSYHSLL